MNCLQFVRMSLAVILLLSIVGESTAQNEIVDIDSLQNEGEVLETGSGDEGEVLETVRDLLQEAESLLLDPAMTEKKDTDPDDNKMCTCDGLKCICCQKVKVKVLKIKTKCCVKVTLTAGTKELQIDVKLGSRTIFKKTFSVSKPRPVCVDASLVLKKGVAVCLDLYDVRIQGAGLSACVRIQIKLYSRAVAKYRIGCFRIKGSEDAVESFDELEQPASDCDDDYNAVENDLESAAAFDGEELTGGQKEDPPLPPDDDQVVFMENIEVPINNLGENQL